MNTSAVLIFWLALFVERGTSISAFPILFLQELSPYQAAATERSSTLLDASDRGDVDEVRALLRAGASLAERNKADRTALMLSVAGNHREVARLLLAAGANVNEAANDTWTPLLFALCCSGPELFKDILAAGADLNARYGRGRTPLMVAAEMGDNQKIEILLNVNVRPYDLDDYGCTALMYAAVANGNNETIKILLAAGIDINAKDVERKTALSYAQAAKRQSIVELLKESGAIE